jgi:hypothetical protein
VVHLAVEIRVQVRLQDVLERAQLGDLLALERLGVVQDLAIPVAQEGDSDVFMKVWPVLKSLPPMGTLFLRASSSRAGVSTVRLGAPLA